MIFDNEQKKVIEHTNGKISVVAAPGSGKTRTLVERAKSIVKTNKVNYNEILLITFTEKAKSEIIERFTDSGFKPDIETFHSLAYKSLCYYNNINGVKTNILNSSEDKLIDRMSRSFSKDEYQFQIEKKNIKDSFNLYSFDDLMFNFEKQLRGNGCSITSKYKYIMVDECQDLDSIQYSIISLINCPNLLLIGDLNQSIYGWRGSKLELFNEYTKTCDRNYYLINNYRSGENIINLSNSLIKNNDSYVSLNVNPVNKLNSFVVKKNFTSSESQVKFVINEIQKLVREKNNSKIALIFRCDYQKESFINELNNTNLIFNVLTNKYDELNDLISIYKAINGNILSMYQIADRLHFDIETLDLNSINDKAIFYINSLVNKVNSQFDDIFSKIKYFMKEISYCERVYKDINQSLDIIDKIFKVSIEKLKENKGSVDLGNILSSLTINSLLLLDKNEDTPYIVDIMTIHGSKGLEYDFVFIPDVNSKLLPHKNGIIEEERRLFYVGITRAKIGVYISSINKSEFIDEV